MLELYLNYIKNATIRAAIKVWRAVQETYV